MSKYKVVFQPGIITDTNHEILYGNFYIDRISGKSIMTDKLVSPLLGFIGSAIPFKNNLWYQKEVYIHIVNDEIPQVKEPYFSLWEYSQDVHISTEDNDYVYLKGTCHHNKKIVATLSTLPELSHIPKIKGELLKELLCLLDDTNCFNITYINIPEKFSESIDQLIENH